MVSSLRTPNVRYRNPKVRKGEAKLEQRFGTCSNDNVAEDRQHTLFLTCRTRTIGKVTTEMLVVVIVCVVFKFVQDILSRDTSRIASFLSSYIFKAKKHVAENSCSQWQGLSTTESPAG